MVDTTKRAVSAHRFACTFDWMRQFRRAAVMLPLLGAVALAGLLLTGCTTVESGGSASPAPASGSEAFTRGSSASDSAPALGTGRIPAKSAASAYAPPSQEASNLGTAWGETRESRIGYSQFVRGSSQPSAVSSIYYNSRQSILALVGNRYSNSGFITAGSNSGVVWRVRSGGGLPWWSYEGRHYVAGVEGSRYTLEVRNNNSYRVEAVLTVDGLDVMDGRSGSFSKRGYIIEPDSTLKVDGFRQSTESVAAFRFSAVGGSYANLRHGDTRNVGVIGLAVFEPRRVYSRGSANPFPESPYAKPPPGIR